MKVIVMVLTGRDGGNNMDFGGKTSVFPFLLLLK